jgi:NAD(P)H-hydrate epimerase
VVGGSTGIVGAAVLAGRAALSFGAGSVVVASPRADVVNQVTPELPTFGLVEALSRLDRFDVVVAGPGLAAEDAEQVHAILAQANRLVLDAGALSPESLQTARDGGAEVVVTPHDGEFQRIAGVGAGTYSVRSFARRNGVIALRKGNPTMISDGGLPVLVTTGGPELASIGTGDVLSGMIGALWSRGLEPMEAAISGAYWHGKAGADLAAERSVTAAKLVERIASFAW